MNKLLIIAIAVLLSTLWAVGCSKDGSGDSGSGSDGDSDGDADGDGSGSDGDSDSDADMNGSGDTDFSNDETCGTINTDLNAVTSRVMILLDKSSSMTNDNKWDYALQAINTMVDNFDGNIDFGLDLFSRGTQGSNENCSVGDSVVLDVAPANGANVISELANWDPTTSTPLYLGMNNYTIPGYAPIFMDGEGASYLVVISDGGDSCGTEPTTNMGSNATAQELGAVAASILEGGTKTIVIGFGTGAEPDQLNAIAEAGGSVFSEYILAEDGDALVTSLNTIGEKVQVTCEFEVGTFAEEVDYSRVVVTFDGEQVARDVGCSSNTGWTWMDDTFTTIQFCDAACTQLESGEVDELNIRIACPDEEIVEIIDTDTTDDEVDGTDSDTGPPAE